MIVSAIQYSKNNGQKNNHMVKPVQSEKNSTKDEAVENAYQLLLQQALKVYQR